MNLICKIFNKFFFRKDFFYIFVEPLRYPSSATYLNYLKNLYYYISKIKTRELISCLHRLCFKIFLDFLKFFYLPLSTIIYFSRFRFIQLDYSQIGALGESLSSMTKEHLIKGFIPIICIPKNEEFSFIKKIFKELIILDNMILNILFFPLIQTNFISFSISQTSSFLDGSFKKINNFSHIKKNLDYNKLIKRNYFKLSSEYNSEMKKFFKEQFKSYDIKNTFVLHVRDNNYIKTSYLRSAAINNYILGIKFLIKKNFYLIRLTHSKSNRLEIKNKNYSELNIDLHLNKYFQFYLLSNCKGFICCNSGPASLSLLMSTPILQLNCIDADGLYAHRINDLYTFKKIQNSEKKLLNFKAFFKSNMGTYVKSARKMKLEKLEAIENSPREILESIKEFVSILRSNKINTLFSQKQNKFRESLIGFSNLGYGRAKVVRFFFKKNYDLFI